MGNGLTLVRGKTPADGNNLHAGVHPRALVSCVFMNFSKGGSLMSLDLTALLNDKVGSTLVNYITGQLGESPSVASKAVSLVLPALLGGLVRHTDDSARMTNLFNLVTGPQIDSTVTQVQPTLLDTGRHLLSSLLGDTSGLTNLLANKSGLSAGNAGSLLAAALPLVLGALRSHVQTNNLTQPQFVGLLSEQKGFLAKLLDGDFLGGLGLGALGAAATGAVSSVAAGASSAAAAVAPPAGGAMKWLWMAGAALAAVLLIGFCSNRSKTTEVPPPAPTPAASAVVAASAAPAVAASGTASEPVTASADAGSVKYEDGVLSVYFATGKTDFDTATAKTLAEEIVKAGKDGKKLAVSGYNDPRGNAALNAELSKNRAKAVKAFLIAEGVPEGNVELVKPADTTGTASSNAEDRRVDVRVM